MPPFSLRVYKIAVVLVQHFCGRLPDDFSALIFFNIGLAVDVTVGSVGIYQLFRHKLRKLAVPLRIIQGYSLVLFCKNPERPWNDLRGYLVLNIIEENRVEIFPV